jgi:hypothetical protein
MDGGGPRYTRHRQGGARPLSGQQTKPTKRGRVHYRTNRETRLKIRELFDAGTPVDDIATAVGETRGYVCAHLKRAGRELEVFTRLIPGMAQWLKIPAPLYLLNDGRR